MLTKAVEKKSDDKLEVVDHIKCPLTLEIFHTPMLLDCGNEHSVEQDCVASLLACSDKRCPVCRQSITKATPNRMMRIIVDAYLKEHPDLTRYKPLTADEKKQQDEAVILPVANPLNEPYESPSPEEVQQQQEMLQMYSSIVRLRELKQDSSAPLERKDSIRPEAKVSMESPHSISHEILPRELSLPEVKQRQEVLSPVFASVSISAPESASRVNRYSLMAPRSAQAILPEHKLPRAWLQGRDNSAIFNILLIGDLEAGKGELLRRFCDDSFNATSGIEYKTKILDVDRQKIMLRICDTAGQERFKTITTAYYKSCHGILLMYNVSSESSFHNVRSWKRNIEQYVSSSIPIILIGTHLRERDRLISAEQGQALADEYRIPFFECSAKDNLYVAEVFQAIARAAFIHAATQNSQSRRCIIM